MIVNNTVGVTYRVTPASCIRAKIGERRRFLRSDTPDLNPRTIRYKNFWRTEIQRCVEGMWIVHDTGHLWVPPILYFYGNYGTILLQKHKKDKRKIKARPFIRDLEWQVVRYWTVCRGFSGFVDDPMYTCDERLDVAWQKREDPELLTVPRTTDDIRHDDEWHLFRADGTHKIYIDPYEYMRMTFAKPMGRALYLNEAQDFVWLGSRGGGKSYLSGGIVAHEFLFNGAKEFTKEAMVTSASPVDIVVGAAEKKKSREFLKKVRICLDELPGEYKHGDVYVPSPLSKSQLTGSWEEEVRHEYQVKRSGTWKTEGSKSRILHVAYKDNAEAAAGTRASVMIFEEVGLSTNLIDVYAANVDVMMNGSVKFGSMLYLGTSGNMDKIINVEKIFKNPRSYQVYPIFDQTTDREIGFFMPVYLTLSEFKDANGVTDMDLAEKTEARVRKSKMSDSKLDSTAYHKYVINRPVKWQEMFISNKDNGLPVNEINRRLEALDRGSYFESVNLSHILTYSGEHDSGIHCQIDVEKRYQPINSFVLSKSDSIEGATVIYEHPLYLDGIVPDDLYTFGHDTYVSESREQGGSLGTFYVIRRDKYLTEAPSAKRIVAQYVGKPDGGLDEYYENVLKMLLYYNCGVGHFFFESNRGQHCKNFMIRKLYRLLMNVKPNLFGKKDDDPKVQRIIEYGVPMSAQMKADGIRLIRDWLLQTVDTVTDTEEDGVRTTRIIRIVDTIDDRALLQELAAFDPVDGNYDRLMGLMVGIIGVTVLKYNEEKIKTKDKDYVNPLKALLTAKVFDKQKLQQRRRDISRVAGLSQEHGTN